MYFLFKEAEYDGDSWSVDDSLIPIKKFDNEDKLHEHICTEYYGKNTYEDLYVIDSNGNIKAIKFKREKVNEVVHREQTDVEGTKHKIAYNKTIIKITDYEIVDSKCFQWEE